MAFVELLGVAVGWESTNERDGMDGIWILFVTVQRI